MPAGIWDHLEYDLELLFNVFGDGRWVAKLIARLLATAALWFRTSFKNTNNQHTARKKCICSTGKRTLSITKEYRIICILDE
jgi:hypothetical protein